MTPQQKREWVEDYLSRLNPDALFFSDLDAALVGYAQTDDIHVAVYDYELMLTTLMERDGSSREDVADWFDHNTLGGHLGFDAPIVLHRIEEGA